MKKHITIVGIYHIAVGALMILKAVFIFLIMILVAVLSDDRSAVPVLISVGALVFLFLFALALPGVVGGIGALRYKNWARYLVMIVAVLELFLPPIGTIIGVYSLWALVHDESLGLFTPAKTADMEEKSAE